MVFTHITRRRHIIFWLITYIQAFKYYFGLLDTISIITGSGGSQSLTWEGSLRVWFLTGRVTELRNFSPPLETVIFWSLHDLIANCERSTVLNTSLIAWSAMEDCKRAQLSCKPFATIRHSFIRNTLEYRNSMEITPTTAAHSIRFAYSKGLPLNDSLNTVFYSSSALQ